MFSTLRTRFGIPGVISVMALVFAMFGGAYAASNSSDGGKATASAKKAKKGPRGPKGVTGPAGPAGPAGPQGPAGPKGDAGAAGSNGAPGTSVTNTSVATGLAGKCNKLGGSEFTVGSGAPTFACNGKEGEPGEPGEPWPAGGTLPPGATETGTWSVIGPRKEKGIPLEIYAPISFPIPLEESLGETEVHYLLVGETSASCPGTTHEPKAISGHLCVYEGNSGSTISLQDGAGIVTPDFKALGAAPSGALLNFSPWESVPTFGSGTWAVTG